ncbi:MAG: TolC family protein [Gemmatimonadota bacterium]
MTRAVVVGILVLCWSGIGAQAQAQETVELTLDRAIRLGMEQSYRVRHLRIGIARTRALQQAQRARLKSRVDLSLNAPDYGVISDYEYDSGLGRDVLVHENSRRWQANLSVRQPVVLFGYPTNGYLSLNSRFYRYTQIQDDESYTRYYNRYFVAYEQPLFQPNTLRYELQEAEYDTEGAQMDFRRNVVRLMEDMAEAYYALLDLVEQRQINEAHVAQLERAAAAARARSARDPAHAGELAEIRVELANARERVEQARSEFRLEAAGMKQRLRLEPSDSLTIKPVALEVEPVHVDVERAVEFGMTLTPRMRQLEIWKWDNTWNIERTRARRGFRLDLELTYGREMADTYLMHVLEEPRNSYTVSVNAHVPIWDWGERAARVHAAELRLEQTELSIQEAESEIRSDIINAVETLEAYQDRALVMQENLTLAEGLAEESLARYEAGEIGILELLRSLDRNTETAMNFLDTYLGYRSALLDLQQMTYFDFEIGGPVFDRFEGTAVDGDMDG